MKTPVGNTLAALRGVEGFVDRNSALLPSVVSPATVQARMQALLVRMNARVGLQDGIARSARMLTQTKKEAKAKLLDENMEVIKRTAVADLPRSPELKELMTVNRRASIARLLQAADGMAAAAMPFEAILIEGGLKPDFIASLRAAAKALEVAVDDKKTAVAQTGSATRSLTTLDRAAKRAIALIDSHVKVDLKNEPDLLDEWKSIKRPQKVPVAPSTTTATTPTTPTTPTTAPATTPVAAAG
jgi:hypothetical protein